MIVDKILLLDTTGLSHESVRLIPGLVEQLRKWQANVHEDCSAKTTQAKLTKMLREAGYKCELYEPVHDD